MTRKDYVAIAEAIKVSRWEVKAKDYEWNVDAHNAAVLVTARNIADVMQHDNPRFDRQRFLRACGVA